MAMACQMMMRFHGWRLRDRAIYGSVCESIWGFARVEADWLEFRKSGEVWQIDAFVTSKSFCMWLLRRPWILVRLGLQFLLLLLLYLLRQISMYFTSTDGVTTSAMALTALVGGSTLKTKLKLITCDAIYCEMISDWYMWCFLLSHSHKKYFYMAMNFHVFCILLFVLCLSSHHKCCQ